MSVIPEEFLDMLQSKALMNVATIGPKGEPQVSATMLGWDGTSIFFTMNRIRQKRRNLEREPRIALSITDPTNPFRSIEIRGRARIEEDVEYHFTNLLSQKYFGRDATADLLPGEERVVVFIEPERAIPFPPPTSK
jgi:PPOX class probable F420-dependent enzyme